MSNQFDYRAPRTPTPGTRHELIYETVEDEYGTVPKHPVRAVVFEVDANDVRCVATIIECKSKRQARYILNKYYDYGLPRAVKPYWRKKHVRQG